MGEPPGVQAVARDPRGRRGAKTSHFTPPEEGHDIGEHIETVERIYEAFGEGDVATILDQLTDDVDWASEAGSNAGAPWHGVHRGKAEVPRFFQALGEAVDVTEFTPIAFAWNDDDVMVVIRFGLTVRETGKSGTMDLHHWWHFRDSKVDRYRGTEDTALTAALLTA